MSLMENYNKALQELYEHVGFKEDWVVCPIDDSTEYFWSIIGDDAVRYIETDKPNLKEAIEEGSYYEDEIYTQRFYKKWVYGCRNQKEIF